MKSRSALALIALLSFVAASARADLTPGATNPKDECAAVGILLVDLDERKVAVIPDRLEVTYAAAGTKREICFAWFVSKGKKAKKIKKFELAEFEDLKGKAKLPVLKAGKLFSDEIDIISLIFYDEPVWDADGDGYAETAAVKETYSGLFADEDGDLKFDPEVIIKKPGG